MRWLLLASTAIGLALLLAGPARAGDAGHDRRFWIELRDSDFRVSAREALLPLALEAAQLLGSPDAELRDEVAYSALVSWVYRERRLSDEELEPVRMMLVENSRSGLGEVDTDSLFLRSFSVLGLSVFAAADLKQPFLTSAEFHELVELGVQQLSREKDLRGYVPGKGWGHATAHDADLLKFLARSPRLTQVEQGRIVAAIAERLRSVDRVFIWGEDARLAAALLSLALRPDPDPGAFLSWTKRLAQEHAALWAGKLDVARYVSARAQLNALGQLAADLECTATGPCNDIRVALRELRAATR